MRHARDDLWVGVNVDGTDDVRDNMDAFVWEPSLVKLNAISSAAEAACLILNVDGTVRSRLCATRGAKLCVICFIFQ